MGGKNGSGVKIESCKKEEEELQEIEMIHYSFYPEISEITKKILRIAEDLRDEFPNYLFDFGSEITQENEIKQKINLKQEEIHNKRADKHQELTRKLWYHKLKR